MFYHYDPTLVQGRNQTYLKFLSPKFIPTKHLVRDFTEIVKRP
jgi:hypothetical protein